MTESEIIAQILNGDRNQFGLLVNRYQAMVFRTVMGFLHNKDNAEDLTQEIFIQAYQSLNTYKGTSSFSTWIYRIAVNASLNKIRKSSKNFLMQRLDAVFGVEKNKEFSIFSSDNENPETILINQEHSEWLQNALNSLPENQRTAYRLYSKTSKEVPEITCVHFTNN